MLYAGTLDISGDFAATGLRWSPDGSMFALWARLPGVGREPDDHWPAAPQPCEGQLLVGPALELCIST